MLFFQNSRQLSFPSITNHSDELCDAFFANLACGLNSLGNFSASFGECTAIKFHEKFYVIVIWYH